MPKQKGFTLIELLITISIIAILAAIGIVVYSSALKSGRDTKRQSDLRAVQSALEQYHNDQGFYPTDTGGLDSVLSSSPPPAFTNCTGNPVSPCTVTKTYMNSLPQDPQSSQPRYKYEVFKDSNPCDNLAISTRCTRYCLNAKLENSSPPRPPDCNNASYNFVVAPP